MYYVESDASFIRYLNMYERRSIEVLKRIDEFVNQENIENVAIDLHTKYTVKFVARLFSGML